MAPAQTRKRTAAQAVDIEPSSPSDHESGPSRKRQRRPRQDRPTSPQSDAIQSGGSRAAPIEIEDIDAIDVEEDENPAKDALKDALQKQREEQVKAQREESDKPLKLNNLSCVICMEPVTNITATSCGHIFCHHCLIAALNAGEARRRPGEAKRSQCPNCRKNLDKNKAQDVIPLLIKEGLKTQPRKKKTVVK